MSKANFLEYLGYRLYSILSRILPLRLAYKFADFVGYLVFRIKQKESEERTDVMRKMPLAGVHFKKTVCKNMQFFNRDMADFFRCGGLNKRNIDSFVKISGIEYLDSAIKKGKGVILASAHLGNWEMSGVALAVKGYPVYGMVWGIGNRFVANMFRRIRGSKGLGTAKSSSLKHIIELLRENKIIGIMLDIYGGIKGVSYNLWGYNVRLPRGPAALSQYTGAELLTMINLRDKSGGYKMFIEKPDMKGTEEEVTIRAFENLKKYIEMNPVQWHWIRYFFEPLISRII